MKWYLISYDEWPENRRRSFSNLWGASLFTPDKTLIESKKFSILNDYEIKKGFDIRCMSFLYFKVRRGRRFCVGDCLGYEIRLNYIFSEKFMSCLGRDGLAIDAKVIRKPIKLVDENFKPIGGEGYTLLWREVAHDCLDMERSEIEYFSSVPGLIRNVNRFVFLPEKIPDCHLFALKDPSKWVVSEDVVKSSERAGCDGISFEEVAET